MQVRLPGTVAESWPELSARLTAAGFQAVAHSDGVWCLTAGDECEAWLRLHDGSTGVVATVWLPDEGDSALCEALVAAIDPPGQTPATSNDQLLRRLRRIEGQVRGVQRMIEAERDCKAVLTQLAAVSAAMRQTAALIVSDHLVECIRDELSSGGDISKVNQRLLKVLF